MGPYSPTIAAYLDALPRGVDSYPETCVKASLVRNAIEDRPLVRSVALPAAVRALVDAPPPVSVWVPEVHFHVIMNAIRDEHFGARTTEFLAWVYEQNRKLFSGTLYRAIFLVVSPERLLNNMEKRWGSFRCGTTLTHKRLGANDLELNVTTPAHLYSPASLEGMSAALRAAIDAAGAKASTVTASSPSPTTNVFRIRWQ